MSHFVAAFQGLPNSLVGLNSYNKLTDADRLKANLDMANRQILQDEIRDGYTKSLIQSEKNRQAVLKVAEGNYQINASVQQFASEIDMRMRAIIEQVELINTGVESLREVMMIPDNEKERLFNFREGIKFLEQALINPKRYSDALHYLTLASEKNSRDYLVNHEIGKIYLYNSTNLNISRAIIFLELSLDYCETEAPSVASEVALHLAFAHYLDGNFSKAIEMGELSYSLDNNKLEAKYISGECKLLSGNKEGAIEDIRLVINSDVTYTDKIINNENILKFVPIVELKVIEKSAKTKISVKKFNKRIEEEEEIERINHLKAEVAKANERERDEELKNLKNSILRKQIFLAAPFVIIPLGLILLVSGVNPFLVIGGVLVAIWSSIKISI